MITLDRPLIHGVQYGVGLLFQQLTIDFMHSVRYVGICALSQH